MIFVRICLCVSFYVVELVSQFFFLQTCWFEENCHNIEDETPVKYAYGIIYCDSNVLLIFRPKVFPNIFIFFSFVLSFSCASLFLFSFFFVVALPSSSWFYSHASWCYSYANVAVSQATNDFGEHVKSFSIYILKFANSPLGHHWLSGQLQNKIFSSFTFAILFPVNYVVLVLYWSQQSRKVFPSFFFIWWIDRKCFTQHYFHFSISDVNMHNS